MFGCHTLATSQQSIEAWHPDDYSIDCHGPTHSTFKIAAAACMVLYPFGIPLTFFALLKRDQRTRAESDTGSAFDFLRKDYQFGWYYMEVVVLIEKLIVSSQAMLATSLRRLVKRWNNVDIASLILLLVVDDRS